MYHVEIQTADEKNAGTDADISVEFKTVNGKTSGKHSLDNPGNDFEQNYNDFYSFNGTLDPSDELASVTIKHSGSNGWKMAWLKVSIGGKTWKATPTNWFLNDTQTLPLLGSVGRQNWMSALDPTATVDQMNIPGTHDSGTCHIDSAHYHHTQDLTITQQLLLGIRYFDMRLSCIVNPHWTSAHPASQHANFKVYHEGSWGQLYFDKLSWVAPSDVNDTKGYVLQDILAFLKDYPSEFVLLQVQREHNTVSRFETFFKDLVSRHSSADFLVTDTYPTYADAKGKIVILSMANALPHYGIQLEHGKLVKKSTYYLENHWMDANKEVKWDKVEMALRKAMEQNAGQWVINYMSDGSGALHPREFAKYINEWARDFIVKHGTDRHYGTVIADFPTRSLVAAILAKYIDQ